VSQFEWSEEENRCFGCGENPWGLGLEFEEEEGWVRTDTRLDRRYQGFQDYAHGGIVATMLDEASAWAVRLQLGSFAPSYEINCRLRKPAPLEEPLTVRAQAEDKGHGVALAQAQLLDREGSLLAEAEIKCKMV